MNILHVSLNRLMVVLIISAVDGFHSLIFRFYFSPFAVTMLVETLEADVADAAEFGISVFAIFVLIK